MRIAIFVVIWFLFIIAITTGRLLEHFQEDFIDIAALVATGVVFFTVAAISLYLDYKKEKE